MNSAVGFPGCNPRETSSTADSLGTVAKTNLHQAISGIGEVQVHRQMYRVPACEIWIEACGSQRGLPCQDCQTRPLTTTSIREYRLRKTELLKLHLLKRELVNEILYQSQQERKSDSRSESKDKHRRVLLLQIHGVPAAVGAVQASVPVRIPAAVKPRLHHRCRLTKAIRTAQKDRNVLMVLIWSWKGWSWNQSGVVFNGTLTVIFWCKSSRTLMSTLTEFLLKMIAERDCEETIDTVRCAFHQSMWRKCFQA